MFDGLAEGAEFAEIVRGFVERATAPLIERIALLENRKAFDIEAVVAELTARGFAKTDGWISGVDFEALETRWADQATTFDEAADRIRTFGERLEAIGTVDLPALAEQIDAQAKAAAQSALAQVELPKDGKDADPELIREMVAVAVAELPPPRDGIDGKDIDPDAIDLMIAQAVAKLPAPKDGSSITVDDVAPMIAEAVEKAIANIPVAKDGVGLAGAVIGREGNLIVTLTDGQTRDLGLVVGRDGIDAKGEPGRDALQLTDFDADLTEDGRFLTLSLENDEHKITHELQLPTMIYRGVFKDGAYLPGDMVTWAGSLWHCEAATTDKPGEGSKLWTLAAKRGRDGKDAK